MNKLLRFKPEPFDLEAEAMVSLGSMGQAEAREQEEEVRGGRGRSASFRSSARASQIGRSKRGSSTSGTPSPGPQYSPGSRQNSAWPRGRRRWYDPVDVVARGYYDEPAGRFAAVSSEQVAWAQGRLNDALGLRLATNGVLNAPTRSAIRLFQERFGLSVNGRLGPETEAALREGGRQARGEPPPDGPPELASEPPEEAAGEFEAELDAYHVDTRAARKTARPGIKALRERIVRIAQKEATRWADGGVQETDPRIRAVLQDYWKTGPGLSFTPAELGSATFQASHPWSAAFISWVMRKAGAGAAFKYSASHSVYISAAKANRIAGNANPFKAYRLSEVAPRTGDLVCRSRSGSGATYDTIRPGMNTHCDVVVEVKPGALTVIGGNVSNSVKRRTVHTDSAGRVVEKLAFAVIRVGTRTPPMPAGGLPGSAPQPAPQPGLTPTPASTPGMAPKLLKREASPPAETVYAEIDLGIVDRFKKRATPMSGIFLPEGYTAGSAVDIILYLHGHKAEASRALAIDEYWNGRRFPYGALREKLNAAGRRAVLVAPTLGARSEAGSLVKVGGLDAYVGKILAAVGASRPGGPAAPTLRHLILACHSGGGLPMRALAGGADKALSSLRECWGFDCTYNGGDDSFWAAWARKSPRSRCYFYYIKGSPTAALSERLRAMKIGNAIVQPARDARHNYVPITHWLERVDGAAFLPQAGSRISPPAGSPAGPPATDDEPGELGSLSHPAFIALVGARARRAMAATGVPASVTVAQAILETGWGKHTIGLAKNLFGIKGKGPAGSVQAATREFKDGAWITIQATFAKYDSFAQSIEEHARLFLKNKRWAPALLVKNDADSFARAIQKAGYATAPDYSSQLIKLMKAHDLYQFDRA